MKINTNKLLNIIYSILNNDEIYSVNIADMVEIIKILLSSDEFKIVGSRLDINDFSNDTILKNKYTTELDDNMVVSFEVPEEDREKILNLKKVDAGIIQQAVNKRAMAKMFAMTFNNRVVFRYDSPNGEYNIQKASFSDYETESIMFTDGKCVKNDIYTDDFNGSITRNINIDDSTFTICIYYIDNEINRVEVRGDFRGDYNLLLTEIKRMLNGMYDSFVETESDAPRVYSFKRH